MERSRDGCTTVVCALVYRGWLDLVFDGKRQCYDSTITMANSLIKVSNGYYDDCDKHNQHYDRICDPVIVLLSPLLDLRFCLPGPRLTIIAKVQPIPIKDMNTFVIVDSYTHDTFIRCSWSSWTRS